VTYLEIGKHWTSAPRSGGTGALRDFVLQDTAQLLRDAETASQREQEAPRMVSEFVRQMAGTSLTKLDETITDLTQLRDFLHAEGERIKREISTLAATRCSGSLRKLAEKITQAVPWVSPIDNRILSVPTRGSAF
jgi:hypothetical protein